MTDAPQPPAGCPGDRAPHLILLLFRAVLAAAVLLALVILLLPGPAFLAFSNYLQIFAAIAGSLAFLYLRGRTVQKEPLLWAACGLGLWGIANIAWYANVMMGLRALVFPSLIDAGMIASFFLLAVAVHKGFPERDASKAPALAVLATCLIVPAIILFLAGISTAAVVTLLYFLACGILLGECIRHPGVSHAELFAGSLLFALAFMVYPLREMFFVQSPFLNIIGTMVSAGFALIVTGWLSSIAAGQRQA
jgi:hypothetical protein